jgi:hypothetical protein
LAVLNPERFVRESAGFLRKPGKLELKINLKSPMSFEESERNPFGMNLSFSINGGKSFAIGGN